MTKNNGIVIYQTDNGAIQLNSDASAETIWATQKQMAEVFDVNVRTINEHIKNIFNDEELPEIDSVIRNFRITESSCNSLSLKIFFRCSFTVRTFTS